MKIEEKIAGPDTVWGTIVYPTLCALERRVLNQNESAFFLKFSSKNRDMVRVIRKGHCVVDSYHKTFWTTQKEVLSDASPL